WARPSACRQSHHEAGAQHARLSVARCDAGPILDADLAAMGFDDLLGDRQAEPGILTEPVFRPVGVKALENLVERFRTATWPVVVDQDFHLVFQTPARDAHGAPRR